MSKTLDTSWFDLKNYNKLNELDLRGWYCQLLMRYHIKFFIEDEFEYQDEDLYWNEDEIEDEIKDRYKFAKKWLELIKIRPIITEDDWDLDLWYKKDPRYPFNTFSVESTRAHDFWSVVGDCEDNEGGLKNVWKCCELYDLKTTSKYHEIANTPFDVICKEKGFNISLSNVTVDLTASDEQIMSDFRHWLTEYRKVMGYESKKNNFTNRHLLEWVKYRLLPYIDLTLIAELKGKTIPQAKMANLLFGDWEEKPVNIVERLRKVTAPKAEWLLDESTLRVIEVQLSAEA